MYLKRQACVAEQEPKLETQLSCECPGQDNAQGITTAPCMQYIYLVVAAFHSLFFIRQPRTEVQTPIPKGPTRAPSVVCSWNRGVLTF